MQNSRLQALWNLGLHTPCNSIMLQSCLGMPWVSDCSPKAQGIRMRPGNLGSEQLRLVNCLVAGCWQPWHGLDLGRLMPAAGTVRRVQQHDPKAIANGHLNFSILGFLSRQMPGSPGIPNGPAAPFGLQGRGGPQFRICRLAFRTGRG